MIPCSPLWLSSLSALKGTAPSALQGNRGLIPGFLFGELDLSLIDGARVFHFGTLSLTDEPVRTTTQKAVAYAREKGKDDYI